MYIYPKEVVSLRIMENIKTPTFEIWLGTLGAGSCLGWVLLVLFPPLGIIVWVLSGLLGLVVFPALYIINKVFKRNKNRKTQRTQKTVYEETK